MPTKQVNVCLPEVVTASEAARYLRVSIRTVSRLIARGTLRASKLTPGQQGRRRIRREDLMVLLEPR